ncbi:hypothetical protein [Streptomyces sp. NPDC006997]|uniref:hypothetical protein n=1 Tax=Streptomyces sp. NPDC006997 TaxID=3155356 RepID=UPI0033D83809
MTASSQTPGAQPPRHDPRPQQAVVASYSGVVPAPAGSATPAPARTTPVDAATTVITAAMARGESTARDLAQAEQDAGVLADATREQAAIDAARAQARTECAAEIAELRQQLAAIAGSRRQVQAVLRLCEGRRGDDMLLVSAVAVAAECGTTALDGLPMKLTWNGDAQVPDAHTTHKQVIVRCTSAYGGRADLVIDGEDRTKLASLLDSEIIRDINAPCPHEENCGSTHDLDGTDVFGWFHLDVAGIEGGPRWYCSPGCVNAAMLRAGDDLALMDQAAAVDPDQQAPGLPYEGDPLTYGPSGIRCGCGLDAHSNLVPCQPVAEADRQAEQGGAW